MTKPYCDDCQIERNLPKIEAGCYAFCSFCGIKRACFGDDPEPQQPRLRRIPEWPVTDPLR